MWEACVLYVLCMEAMNAQQSSEFSQPEPRHSEIKKADIGLAASIGTKLKTHVITCIGDKRNWNIKYSWQLINLSYNLPLILIQEKTSNIFEQKFWVF